MKYAEIKKLYYSLSNEEKYLLQLRRQDFELNQNVKFVNLESYVNHLALEVINRQRRGEFVPRNKKGAQAGHYL